MVKYSPNDKHVTFLTMNAKLEIVLASGYIIVHRNALCKVTHNVRLVDRALQHRGQYILFDPSGRLDGLLLVGDDLNALLNDCIKFIGN